MFTPRRSLMTFYLVFLAQDFNFGIYERYNTMAGILNLYISAVCNFRWVEINFCEDLMRSAVKFVIEQTTSRVCLSGELWDSSLALRMTVASSRGLSEITNLGVEHQRLNKSLFLRYHLLKHKIKTQHFIQNVMLEKSKKEDNFLVILFFLLICLIIIVVIYSSMRK